MKKLILILLLSFILIGCNIEKTEESFSVSSDSIYLAENEGTHIPIYYAGIEEERISVSFSNEEVLEFDSKELYVKARNIGFTKININVKDSDYTATIDVYVEASEIVKPVIQPSHNLITVDTPFTFFFKNATKVGASIESFEYSVNDEELAQIDENFIIHPKKAGTLTVTATLKSNPEITTSFDIEIVQKDYSEKYILTTQNNTFNVLPGEYLNLYVDGSNENLERDFYFSSWSTDIASITADGKIVGIKEGLAYVGVKSKTTGKSGVIYVEVKGKTNKIDYKQRLLDLALSEAGYRETSEAWTKFGEWYDPLYANLDWCAMFVAYNANEAGIPTTIIPRLAKVEFFKTTMERQGRFHYSGDYTPVAGDLIMFGNLSHIAIVLYVKDGRVYTMEGNTSRMAAERNYDLDDSYILGYGNPDYEKLNH